MRTGDATSLRNVTFLFVLPSLELGGAERQALLLARYLCETAGARVHAWGFGAPGTLIPALEGLGIEGRPVPLPPGGARVAQLRLAAGFVRDARALRANVLLPYSRVPNRLCGLVWRWTGARLCVWNHRDGTGAPPSLADRWAMRRTPAVVANSRHGAAHLARAYDLPASRVMVIRNGVELAPAQAGRDEWRCRLGAGERTLVACMVANLTSNKDHATLVRAWRTVVAEMASSGRQAMLVLAGSPGDAADATRELVAQLGLAASVHVLGHTPDVSGLLRASDLGVFSSRVEGCPNGVLECMAAGLAVVGTDIDGIREALGGAGAAHLAPAGDHEAFAGRVVALANDPASRERAGRANLRRAGELFSPHEMGARMAAVCAAHLARR